MARSRGKQTSKDGSRGVLKKGGYPSGSKTASSLTPPPKGPGAGSKRGSRPG